MTAHILYGLTFGSLLALAVISVTRIVPSGLPHINDCTSNPGPVCRFNGR